MASDNFNRANETPLGSPWVADSVWNSAVWLRSNLVSGSDGNKALTYYSGSTTKDSTVTFVSNIDQNNSGPAICLDGAGSGYYCDHGEYIVRIDSGSQNFIGSNAAGSTAGLTGAVVRIYRDGNDVVATTNGVEYIRVTDTTYMTGSDGLLVQEQFERFGAGWGSQLDDWLSASTAGPTITDVNTTEIVLDGSTGNAVTGTAMGAGNADRAFTLRQTGATVTQVETGTGTATAATLTIAVDMVGADIKFGSATLRVTRVSDSLYGELAVTVNPPTGQLYVDVETPEANSLYRITATGDIVSGDQIQARGQGGGSVPTGLSILSDGTWSFSMGNTPAAFDVRIWDQSDSTWGAWATQTISTAATIAWLRA